MVVVVEIEFLDGFQTERWMKMENAAQYDDGVNQVRTLPVHDLGNSLREYLISYLISSAMVKYKYGGSVSNPVY